MINQVEIKSFCQKGIKGSYAAEDCMGSLAAQRATCAFVWPLGLTYITNHDINTQYLAEFLLTLSTIEQ